MLNYKINNHGKNEIKHDYLIFITAKEKSYTAKTGAPGPKQVICLKNKLLTEKTKVVVSSFWSKAIQVRGASLCNMPRGQNPRRHPRIPRVYAVHNIRNFKI